MAVPNIINNNKRFSKVIGAHDITNNTPTFSKDFISSGGKMFLYLNSCPSYWAIFYENLIKSGRSITEIFKTTLNVRKISGSNRVRKVANDVLAHFSEKFKFQYIQPLSFVNGTKTWTKNITKVKGKIILPILGFNKSLFYR